MTITMDADERAMLVGALSDAVRTPGPKGLRASLDAVGFAECLLEEPATTVRTVLRLQGDVLSRESLLDDVVIAAAGLAGRADAVLHPAVPAAAPTSRLDEGILWLHGVLDVRDGAGLTMLVPVRTPDGPALAVVRRQPDSSPPTGMELDRSLVRVRETAARGEAELAGGADEWTRARSAGLRAVACELTGLTEAMLRMAVEHTTSRVQFGRPLASFQAVKHKLADVRVWLEVADLAIEASFEDDDLVSSVLAKTLAVRASRAAREHCQQVLGGMGFSWEHPLHRYVRRALVLEPLLGSATALRTEVGDRLLATGVLPSLATLQETP